MKKTFILMAMLCVALTVLARHADSKPFCLGFTSFTGTKLTDCSFRLNWSFDQCATGQYFIEYSKGGAAYTIAVVTSNGNTNSIESYQYTDLYACPNNENGTVTYRIKYKTSTGLWYFSQGLGNGTFDDCEDVCELEHADRCASVPTNLTISGDGQICNNGTELYTLNSGTTPVTWSVTTGSGLVSYNTYDVYEISISNPNNNTGYIVLNANIFGCRSFNKTIALGAPVVAGGLMIYNQPGDENEVCQGAENYFELDITPNCTVNWTQQSAVPGGLSWSQQPYDSLYLYMWKPNQVVVLQLDVSNVCGNVSYDFGFKTISCEPLFTVTPNPARSAISVAPRGGGLIEEISIYDFLGRLKFTRKFNSNQQVTLNDVKLERGTYILKVKSKDTTETHKVIIQ